jgi:crotonobetainyl-CoA:carnitine CoA-transferase CaiB-like acyl-CoA transferase
VPCGPIHDYRQVFEDPHTQAREMEVQVDGTRMLGIPVKLSDTPGSVRRAAPSLGEHSDEVLREAGFSEAQIAGL